MHSDRIHLDEVTGTIFVLVILIGVVISVAMLLNGFAMLLDEEIGGDE